MCTFELVSYVLNSKTRKRGLQVKLKSRLKIQGMWPVLKSFGKGSFVDLFSLIAEQGNNHDLESFSLLCWSLWYARNMKIFQQITESTESIIARGDRLRSTYHLSMNNQRPPSSALENSAIWQPPPLGSLKVNVDATVFSSMDYFGIGMVGRDHYGHVQFAEARRISGILSPHLVELIAIKEG